MSVAVFLFPLLNRSSSSFLLAAPSSISSYASGPPTCRSYQADGRRTFETDEPATWGYLSSPSPLRGFHLLTDVSAVGYLGVAAAIIRTFTPVARHLCNLTDPLALFVVSGEIPRFFPRRLPLRLSSSQVARDRIDLIQNRRARCCFSSRWFSGPLRGASGHQGFSAGGLFIWSRDDGVGFVDPRSSASRRLGVIGFTSPVAGF